MPRLIFFAALVLLLASPAYSQDPPVSVPNAPFVFQPKERVLVDPDGGYFFNHSDGRLVFEAQLAPTVSFFDTISTATTRVLASARPTRFGMSASATFLARLRMLDTTSNPVRTPSYMPKVRMQLAWLKNLSRADNTEDPAAFSRGPIRLWLVDITPFGHHSNGQEGCLFLDQTRVDGECTPAPKAVNASSVNTTNGSFSTNYFRIGAKYRRLATGGTDLSEEKRVVTRWEWGLGGSLELNPADYGPGAASATLRSSYGHTRLRLDADVASAQLKPLAYPAKAHNRLSFLAFRCGRAWASGSLMFARGAADSVDGGSVTAEFGCLPERWGGTGVFVRYFVGQDYYNASFVNAIQRVQFGFTFMQAKFLAFDKPGE